MADPPNDAMVPLSEKGFQRRKTASAKGLNPAFTIGDVGVVMVTQFLAAVPMSALKDQVATLDHHHTTIVDAIYLLMQGF
jgi:hypothetical protein